MRKLVLTALLYLVVSNVFAQPQIAGSGPINTVVNNHTFNSKSFRPPVAADTTALNLITSLDSCGKLGFTYDVNGLWVRGCNPKRWILQSNGNAPVYTADRGVKIITGNVIRLTDTVEGAGTKFQWLYDKAAFRVGLAIGTEWNIANIGYGSFAANAGTTASASYSTAFGQATQASGTGAFSAGINTISSNAGATSFGNSNTASGQNSFAIGLSTIASGSISTSIGNLTKAVGNGSFSTGVGTYMNTLNGVVFGAYNDTTGYYANNTSTQVATDPIFTIGNGSGVGVRSNAFQMLRNGATKFSSGITATTDTTTFKPMVMDASGNVRKTGTWGAGNTNIYNSNGTLTGNRTMNASNKYLHIDSLSGLNFFSYGVAANAGLPYRMKNFMIFDSDENEGASINTDYINGTQSETRATVRTTGVNGLVGMYSTSILSGIGSKIEVDTTNAAIQVQDSVLVDANGFRISGGLLVQGKINVSTGTNKTAGKSTMVLGTVTVNTTQVTASSIILLTPQETGTLAGTVRVSARVNGTSFTITSSNLTDTAEVGWLIIN